MLPILYRACALSLPSFVLVMTFVAVAPLAQAGVVCDPDGPIDAFCARSIIQERGFPGSAESTMIELQNGEDPQPVTCEVFTALNPFEEAGREEPLGGAGGLLPGICFDIGTRPELLAGGAPKFPYGSNAPYVGVVYVPVILQKSTGLIRYPKLMRAIERAQTVVDDASYKPVRVLNESFLTIVGPPSHFGGEEQEVAPQNGSVTGLNARTKIRNLDTGDVDNAFFPPSFLTGPGIYRFVYGAPYLASGDYRIQRVIVETEETGETRNFKSARGTELTVEEHGLP